jgi:hypothetical protein
MSNGSPPSSRPYLSEEPLLVEARGTLRDALGALRNLDQLLHSLRVGPKALSSVLPDVRDSCGPAQRAVDQLLAAAGLRLDNSQAVSELKLYFRPRLDELYRSISHAASTAMHARDRLELERVVTKVAPELEAAQALLDLLEEALAAPSIRLKLRELLDQVSLSEPTGQQNVIEARVEGELENVEILVQPQVAMSLLRLGVNLLRHETPNEPAKLRLEGGPTNGLTIHFESGPCSGDKLLVRQQAIIAPTVQCLDEAVTHMGCKVARPSGSAAFSVTWR